MTGRPVIIKPIKEELTAQELLSLSAFLVDPDRDTGRRMQGQPSRRRREDDMEPGQKRDALRQRVNTKGAFRMKEERSRVIPNFVEEEEAAEDILKKALALISEGVSLVCGEQGPVTLEPKTLATLGNVPISGINDVILLTVNGEKVAALPFAFGRMNPQEISPMDDVREAVVDALRFTAESLSKREGFVKSWGLPFSGGF